MDHLSVMRNPWYDASIDNAKPIESRWSQKKEIPYGKVKKGDWIYPKKTGSHVVTHRKRVLDVLESQSIAESHKLMKQYQNQILVDEDYINSRPKHRYLTLIWWDLSEELKPMNKILAPIPFAQKGQRRWIADYKPEWWYPWSCIIEDPDYSGLKILIPQEGLVKDSKKCPDCGNVIWFYGGTDATDPADPIWDSASNPQAYVHQQCWLKRQKQRGF